jgi:hypothetical protein
VWHPCIYHEWEQYNEVLDAWTLRCQVTEAFVASGLDRSPRLVLTRDSRCFSLDHAQSTLDRTLRGPMTDQEKEVRMRLPLFAHFTWELDGD